MNDIKTESRSRKITQLIKYYSKEDLPIQVRIVRTENQLSKAIDIRADAYGRHTPEFASVLRQVEKDDVSLNSLILLCESKITGDPVGTLRIHTNDYAATYLEEKIKLPNMFKNARIAYVTRLGVASGIHGNYVKLILFKALFRYCFATQIPWILAVARKPVDRNLVNLGFKDIFNLSQAIYQPEDFGNYEVRPLYFNVIDAEREWKEQGHPLYEFMINKRHPDIQIFTSVSSTWAQPRRQKPADLYGRKLTPSGDLFVV